MSVQVGGWVNEGEERRREAREVPSHHRGEMATEEMQAGGWYNAVATPVIKVALPPGTCCCLPAECFRAQSDSCGQIAAKYMGCACHPRKWKQRPQHADLQ